MLSVIFHYKYPSNLENSLKTELQDLYRITHNYYSFRMLELNFLSCTNEYLSIKIHHNFNISVLPFIR
jgi:hypothetical protein